MEKPYHFVACGFIVHDNKVLLVNHRKLKKWLPPGGHIEQNSDGNFIESPEKTVIREIKEETGLDVKIIGRKHEISRGKALFLPEDMHIHPIDEEHDHLGIDYFCEITGEFKETKGDEEFQWFSENELDKENILEGVRKRAKKALKRLSAPHIRRD